MKRIAIFNTNINIGGISSSLTNLLNSNIMKKYQVDLFLTQHNDESVFRFIPKEISIHYLKKDFRNTEEYDVVINYNGYSPKCTVYARKTKAHKRVIWVHNNYFMRFKYSWKFKLLWQSMKRHYADFDVVVFVSEGAKKGFEKIYSGFLENTVVIPNMINSAEILKKVDEQIDIELNQNYHLVSVGELSKHKNVKMQIELFENIRKYRKDIDFYIIGQGKEKQKLEKMVKRKNLGQYIHFLGQKKNPYAYMAKMDGLIFTSLYEGQGMVVREAQLLGLDLFISENLKDYNEEIRVSANLIVDVVNALKRETKYIDELTEYNCNIEKKIEILLGEK